MSACSRSAERSAASGAAAAASSSSSSSSSSEAKTSTVAWFSIGASPVAYVPEKTPSSKA